MRHKQKLWIRLRPPLSAVKAVLEDDTKTAADLEILVAAEVIKVNDITVETILEAVVQAVTDGGGDGDE